MTAWNSMNGLQGGDPAKLATALVHLAGLDEPPLRWAPAPSPPPSKEVNIRLAQADAHRDLSSSLGRNDTTA